VPSIIVRFAREEVDAGPGIDPRCSPNARGHPLPCVDGRGEAVGLWAIDVMFERVLQ
jgi:hypothetical protein